MSPETTLLQATVFGLPATTVGAFFIVWSLVLIGFLLYRIDVKRNDGYISVFGWRG